MEMFNKSGIIYDDCQLIRGQKTSSQKKLKKNYSGKLYKSILDFSKYESTFNSTNKYVKEPKININH